MAAQQQSKWEGKAIANLKGTKGEQVWPLFEDFFNFEKLLPTIDTCYQVKDGLIRCCARTLPTPSDGGESIIKWCHERLVAVDNIERCLTYEVLDNNMGIRSYVATFKVLSISDDDIGDDERGCQIEWSFIADPIDGLTLEFFLGYVDSSLQSMAENVEKALESS